MFDTPNFPVLPEVLHDLRRRHLDLFEKTYLPYYFGCRLRILIVADNFLYFNDSNFGLSELVATLRGMSTLKYPVTVDLAHRDNPSAARLAGATPNFSFDYTKLKTYHQVWIFGSDYPSQTPPGQPVPPPISDTERRALRRFMDEGGGIFATGDHEDLGATVGGYVPRVRSMRQWFFPGVGPQGEPVAPHGSNATRHDTDRAGHDASFSFNDQSDDIPQEITPHWFGGGWVRSVHPVMCTPSGPIRVLPDHAHEGRCLVPAALGGNYSIGADVFREYPDGPDGNPLAPVVVATATMIAGAAAPEFGKPPVPGGSFGVIGAWDGWRAGAFGRIVVDATWHHFININLIGDRGLGLPDPAVPKSMGFLHTAAGQAHYGRIKTYFRNIANWLTPRSARRCLLHRHLWCLVSDGLFLENLRTTDVTLTGRLVFERLRLFGPCDRLSILDDLVLELRPEFRLLVDPFHGVKSDKAVQTLNLDERAAQALADELVATVLGSVAIEVARLGLDPAQLTIPADAHDHEIKPLAKAVDAGVKRGQAEMSKRLKARAADCKAVAALFG